MTKSLSIKSMQQSMTSAISCCCTANSLTAFSKLETLTTESTLIDTTVFCTREWHTIVLELNHSLRGFTTHVMDGILITKPIGTLDSVICVPPPIVFGHVPKSTMTP